MFFKKKKDKNIQDIEQVPMGQPFFPEETNETKEEMKELEDELREEELMEELALKEDNSDEDILEEIPEEKESGDDETAEEMLQQEALFTKPLVTEEVSDEDSSLEESPFKKKRFSFGRRKKKKKDQEAATLDDLNDQDEKEEAEAEPDDLLLEDEEETKDEKSKKRFRFKNLSKKKKVGLCLGVLVLAAAGIYLILFGIPGSGSGDKIYVEQVSAIMELGSGNGGENRYAGVVESQETWNIKQNSDKTVKEIYVKEGDSVKIGDKLFAYDNEEAKLNLEQAKLELERMQNEIKSGEAEIKNLEQEKKSASGSDKLEYTIQIQSQKATNKKTEYEIKSQEAKIKSLKKATKNSVVKSEMDGVVKKINQAAATGADEGDDMEGGGDDTVFMSILATGDYRVKAKVNEQNRYTIEEGKEVIVRSRVDDSQTWKGTITKIDTDNPDESSSSSNFGDSGEGDDETTTSSKYPFYVKLDSSEGLILGQHVYIEPDNGQDKKKTGIWLSSYYIVQKDKESYVWVESLTKRLEKKKVTLGEYDEELDEYQIKSGLSKDDYIAFPENNLKEGMKTTRNASEAAEQSTGVNGEEGDFEDTTEIMPEDDMDDGEDDGSGVGGELKDLEDSGDGEIWDEPVNSDGSVGSLDLMMEVCA